MAHTSDTEYIRALLRLLATETPGDCAALDEADERRWLMIDLGLWGRDGVPSSPADSLQKLQANPTLRAELAELLRYRFGCVDEVPPPLHVPFLCPLTLHGQYTRDEILAALGDWTRAERKEMREGVRHLSKIKADIFLCTLNKTEKQFSPTTMYQDYAISEHLFHWQSQSTTSADSPTGRRYIEHEARGQTILLFAREEKKANDLSAPFYLLGPARYVSHTGSRPMSITWRLIHALPAKLFRRMARLMVG